MTRAWSPRFALCLGLVLLVGAAARVPGLFWGYDFFGTETVVLHHDEPPYTWGRAAGSPFPRGLELNVRLLNATLDQVGLSGLTSSDAYRFLVGRLVSLVYGILTLVVIARLGAALFGSDEVGLLAAFFLALADLHVTYSHIAIPDSAATFWFYAALLGASAALSHGSRRAFVVAAICTGAAAAMRYQLMSVVPLVWWVARSRRRLLDAMLLLVTVAGSAVLFNGLTVNPAVTFQLAALVAGGQPFDVNRPGLPLAYLAVLLVGVGLPVFLLAGYGLVRFGQTRAAAWRTWRDALADDRIAVCLAPGAAFVQACSVVLWAPRHVVVVVPFVTLMAAYGFAGIAHRRWGRLPATVAARGMLALLAIYLAVQVASVQAHFVDDPLEKAGRWLRARVPAGEVVSTFSAVVPPEYPPIAEWKANYLVLSGYGYQRYLFDDFVPARLTGRYPATEGIWGGQPRDAARLRQLFAGELPYRLVKAFRLRFFTPELVLTEAFWYPPPHLHDVLIYERRRERELAFQLLTPSRQDYFVTLDTGRLWRPEPGQPVRLSLNGEPLPVELGDALVHLVLPGRLVSTPHSELRLVSDRPLPHLPVDFVKRLRPLGGEFSVESLLDGDLMPVGFHRSEVGADGAAWRWTNPAGEIVLPPAGSAGPWRHLTMRLRGRPAGGGPPQPVSVFLDGRKIEETAIGGDARIVELTLPAGSLATRPGTLQVVTPAWRPSDLTGSSDDRPLGVAVYWARLTRADRVHRLDPATADGFRAWRPLFGLGRAYRIEAVSFPSDDVTLRADLYAPLDGGASVILLAHGGTPLGRKHALYGGLARRLAEKGYWVLSPDFRGYGESERPSRIASARDLDFTRDLSAALGFLEKRLGGKPITMVGHSFGADVTIALAARDARPAGIVAIAPARRVYQRFLNAPGGRELLRDRMAAEMGLGAADIPLELIEPIVAPITIDNYADHRFPRPLLLVDGELEDEPDLRFLQAIYRRLPGEKAYVTIPNADHYFGIQRQLEERDPVTLGVLADVIDGWIREGRAWSRP
jgi:predicted alpha/beta hydrolase